MAVQIQCPACGVSSPAADSLSGRNVRCKKCGTPFVARPTLDGSVADTRPAPAAAANPFPTLPAEFGRYRVLRLLGKGGMGAVYLAKDSQLGREVALKIPFFNAKESPQRVERFVREAQAAAALHHPNICTVFDAGRIAGTPFLTMAFVRGTALDRAIDPDAPMAQDRAAGIARRVARGLAHAHAQGVVHRDLKPANVMLAEDGEPVVMDFGLAKRGAGGDAADAKLTRDGGVLGTPSYMSPEQVRGDADVGPASDIYSLGVLFYEMLTGQTPYSGSVGAVMGKILAAPVPPLADARPDADPRLDAICRRAMAKSADDRFPSMAAFAQALDDYLTSAATPTMSVELVEPVASPVPVAQAVLPPPPSTPAALAAAPAPFADLTDRDDDDDDDDDDDEAEIAPRRTASRRKPTAAEGWGGRRIGLIAGIAAAVLVPLVALGVFLLRVETANGTLVVEVADDEVEAKVKNGKLVLSGPDGKVRYTLSAAERDKKLEAGAYTVRVEGADGLTLDTPEFVLKKGETVTVRVRAEKKAVAKGPEEPRTNSGRPRPVDARPDPQDDRWKWVHSGGGFVATGGGDWLETAQTGGTYLCKEVARTPGYVELDFVTGDPSLRYRLYADRCESAKKPALAFTPLFSNGRWEKSPIPPPALDLTSPDGADAATVRAAQKAWATYLGEVSHEKTLPLDKAGKARIDLVLLPPGKYYRGSPAGDGIEDERPQRVVTLTKPIWVGKYEVTQTQYEAVVGKNPSHFVKTGAEADKQPVESVTHAEAVAFCQAAGGGKVRLLTEAEWEYAYRAGTRSKWYNGGDETRVGEIAHNARGVKSTAAIGGKQSNAFGLYDMAGNVWEWCADAFDHTFYERGPIVDPACTTGSEPARILRGGSWDNFDSFHQRAAVRLRLVPTTRRYNIGLRVALPAEPSSSQPPTPQTAGPAAAVVRGGDWRVEGRELVQAKGGKGAIVFGSPDWADYDLTFDTRTDSTPGDTKQGGIVHFRSADADNTHVLALGAYGGTFHEAHRIDGGKWVRDLQPHAVKYETDRWHAVAIRVRGDKIRCAVDGQVLFDYADARFPKGRVGFSTWDSVVRWRDVRVTAPDGKVLWDGLPQAGSDQPLATATDFTPLFNGKDLTGWTGVAGLWAVRDGLLVGSSQPNALGYNTCLCADREYADFELRCQLKLVGGAKANSGLQIRSKLIDATKRVVEGPQVDAGGEWWGSLYGERAGGMMQAADPAVVAKAVKPGEFNELSVRCVGTRVTIRLNGVTTVDREFPGLPARGLVGLQLHGAATMAAEFRNVEIKDLSADAKGAGGFVPLFNGKDLTGWAVDGGDAKQWGVAGGAIRGTSPHHSQRNYLLTAAEYADFTLRFEFQITGDKAHGGIALRAVAGENVPLTPTRQIFDHPILKLTHPGRGASDATGAAHWLHLPSPNTPAKTLPDVEVGKWHKVEVTVRGQTCVASFDGKPAVDITLDPAAVGPKDFVPGLKRVKGKVGFQINTGEVLYRNVEIKELPPDAKGAGGFVPLFNGKDLTGWAVDSGPAERWKVADGSITGTGAGSRTRGWLLSEKAYDNFELQLEFQVTPEADGAVGIYALPGDKVGDAPHHLAVKLTAHSDPAKSQTGAIYYWPNVWQQPIKPAKPVASGWNKVVVRVSGGELRVSVNGDEVQSVNLGDIAKKPNAFPGTTRTSGRVGLQQHSGEIRFRNIEIKELPATAKKDAKADPLPVKSVWVGTDSVARKLTVTERAGDTFRARFELGAGIVRDVSGTVKDGKVTWLAKDVKAVKGAAGGDNTGTLATDKDGDRLDFTWSGPGPGSGTFVLRRQKDQ